MPLKILYLDDEVELGEIFFDTFSSDKVQVSVFADSKKAIEAAETNPPDLAFLDYRLPGTTGDEVAQKMKSDFPKFLVTGDITVVTKYKFTKIFSKPYQTSEIESVINSYLKT